MRKEKYATTSAGPLTCLKYLVLVENWMQGLYKDCLGQTGTLIDFLENLPTVEYDNHLLFYSYELLLKCLSIHYHSINIQIII
jgi:hypothetical protein